MPCGLLVCGIVVSICILHIYRGGRTNFGLFYAIFSAHSHTYKREKAVGQHGTTNGIIHMRGCNKLDLQIPGYEQGRRNNPVIVTALMSKYSVVCYSS